MRVVELGGIKTWLPMLGRRLHIVLINLLLLSNGLMK